MSFVASSCAFFSKPAAFALRAALSFEIPLTLGSPSFAKSPAQSARTCSADLERRGLALRRRRGVELDALLLVDDLHPGVLLVLLEVGPDLRVELLGLHPQRHDLAADLGGAAEDREDGGDQCPRGRGRRRGGESGHGAREEDRTRPDADGDLDLEARDLALLLLPRGDGIVEGLLGHLAVELRQTLDRLVEALRLRGQPVHRVEVGFLDGRGAVLDEGLDQLLLLDLVVELLDQQRVLPKRFGERLVVDLGLDDQLRRLQLDGEGLVELEDLFDVIVGVDLDLGHGGVLVRGLGGIGVTRGWCTIPRPTRSHDCGSPGTCGRAR
ncbi:MAG: hypothetical protein R3F34_13820 [Planctomycetota bacterium]